ncbi:MAG: zinc-ribbon domain-containing protein [Candidatus Hermodarchaeota archaeon]
MEQSANFCTNCKHDFSQIPPRKYYTPIYSPQPILENARQAMKMKEKLESNDLFPKFQIAYLVLFVAFVANAFLPFSSEYGMTPRFGYVPYIFGGWIGAVFILLSVLKLRSYQTEKAFNLGVVGCVFVSLLLAYETWLISFREELFFDVGYYLLWGVFFGFVAMLVLIRVLFFVPSFRADYCTQCKKIVTPIRKTSAGEAIFWLCCSGGLGLIIMILLAPKNKCPICFKRKIIKKTLEEVVKYACPKCGDLVYDADEFCSKCGAPLNRSG